MNHQSLALCVRRIVLFCLMAVLVYSCSKDNDENAPPTKFRTVSQSLVDGGVYYYSTYIYDDQGRIEKIFGSQIYSLFTYASDSVFYKEYQLNGFLNASFVMKMDAAGRFLNDGYESYQYNADGKLTRRASITNPSTYVVNTWVDGNNTKEEYFMDGTLANTTTSTYYTDKPNKAGWDYLRYGFYCFFGGASDNLVKKTVTKDKDGQIVSDVDWSYDLDDNGLPVKVTLHLNLQGIFYSYYYTYERIE